MSLSDVEVAQVVDELRPRLRGGTIGKVYQRGAETVVVEIGRERLVVAAHARASRLHLEPPRAGHTPGAAPSAFAMLLRKRLGGLRLADVRVVAPGERVVALEVGPGRDRLVAELTGPHANVFLLANDDTIVGALRRSSSTTRALAPGRPWTPPPPAPADARWRGRKRFGDSPGVADRVAAHYTAELAQAERRELRTRVETAVRRGLDKLERRERALLGDLARVEEAAQLRKLADLLLAHASELSGRGATSATVPDDFEDGTPITIPLDPALDARTNAARYYRQHRRLTAGRKQVEQRLAATRTEAAALRARLARLDALDHTALRELAGEAPPRARSRRQAEPPPRLPYRDLRSIDGHRILVGRSATDNDALTFRFARGGDLWLHTRDAPGSHVIVPLRSGPVTEPTLVDAAMLAAHFSPLGGEAQVDVQYTLVKNLRKPKGSAPGLVYTSDTKTIRVRMDPVRLARLLRRPDDEGLVR